MSVPVEFSSDWTGLETHWSRTHLSRLPTALGLPHLSVDSLLDRIDQTLHLAKEEDCPLGLNTPGPHELLVYPNPGQVSLLFTDGATCFPASYWTRRTTDAFWARLDPTGTIGFSPEGMKKEIREYIHYARALERPYLRDEFPGVCVLIVFPDGRLLITSKLCLHVATLIQPDRIPRQPLIRHTQPVLTGASHA